MSVFNIIHSWGFLVWPLHKGMEGFPSPFWSLKAILWDWSYFSEGLISLYAIPKNCAVIHFFGIAWSDFQSSRFVTWPICYSLLIKKKFLRGESNPSPLDKTCMLYQLSYWGMVEEGALKIIYETNQLAWWSGAFRNPDLERFLGAISRSDFSEQFLGAISRSNS